MWRSNYFYNFFKGKTNNSNKIVKYNSFETFNFQNDLKNKILEIDTKIAENSKALLDAQIIKLKSKFS